MLNTSNFPKLNHLLLIFDDVFWNRSLFSEHYYLNLLEQVAECYIYLPTDSTNVFLTRHFNVIQSNNNLKKFGFFTSKLYHEYDLLVSCEDDVARKISFMYPVKFCISDYPQMLSRVQLFSALTHFDCEVRVKPKKNRYVKLLNNLSSLKNLTNLSISLFYHVDSAFETPEFQFLRFPSVNFLKMEIWFPSSNKKDNFIDHNILTTLSITRQFVNLKSLEIIFHNSCYICAKHNPNTYLAYPPNLNCYRKLVKQLENLDQLKKFNFSCFIKLSEEKAQLWQNMISPVNDKILQFIKNKQKQKHIVEL